jgi:hypothetical protein
MSVLNQISSDKYKSHAAHMGPLGSWVNGSQMCRILTFVAFFWMGFLSSDRRQYSERPGSNFTNNYSGASRLANHGCAPQLFVYATDLCLCKYTEKPFLRQV